MKSQVNDLKVAEVRLVVADEAANDAPTQFPQSEPDVLLVSLATDRDIGTMAADRELMNIHADVSFCGTADKLAWARVYEGRRALDGQAHSPDPVPSASAPAGNVKTPHTYRIWFAYHTLLHHSGGRYVDYDLRKDPRDICVMIEGMPYMGIGTGLASNALMIPKGVIIDALAREPSQPRGSAD
jgi:hypothetical protein